MHGYYSVCKLELSVNHKPNDWRLCYDKYNKWDKTENILNSDKTTDWRLLPVWERLSFAFPSEPC